MTASSREWHQRFARQAAWTQSLRHYLFQRANLNQAKRILEIGCGTGAVLSEVSHGSALLYGLDINRQHLDLCAQNAPGSMLLQGDALQLPFPPASFELIYSHFLLLWLPLPLEALVEMKRIARPGAMILCIAEPDYGGRIDYPQELDRLGIWQTEALRRQGANPNTGRLLSELFNQAGLIDIQTGVLGGEWQEAISTDDFESEWATLNRDLSGLVEPDQLVAYKAIDRQAWDSGSRVLFVPTFFASGRVPNPLVHQD
jgi:SAM-dependent methyltransferase